MKRVLGCGVVGLVLLTLFLGLIAWAVWLHSGLARAERRLDRAWTDLEHAYWQRDRLVFDLISELRRDQGADAIVAERILDAREAASEVLPTPDLVTDEERLREFCKLQEALDDALSTVVSVDVLPNQGGDRAAAFHRLLESRDRLGERRQAYDGVAREYNELLLRPPASWIGTLAGFQEAARFEILCGSLGEGRL